jgi:hypothetical protein
MAQVAMDSIAVLCPEQPVMHAGRRATFLHMSRGEAIIRYRGSSHAVAVPPEALSLPPPRDAARSRRPLAARDEPLVREVAARDAAALQRRLSP